MRSLTCVSLELVRSNWDWKAKSMKKMTKRMSCAWKKTKPVKSIWAKDRAWAEWSSFRFRFHEITFSSHTVKSCWSCLTFFVGLQIKSFSVALKLKFSSIVFTRCCLQHRRGFLTNWTFRIFSRTLQLRSEGCQMIGTSEKCFSFSLDTCHPTQTGKTPRKLSI